MFFQRYYCFSHNNEKTTTSLTNAFVKKNIQLRKTLLFDRINYFLHSMEKKSTKVDFSPISCKKAPFYTRNGHF